VEVPETGGFADNQFFRRYRQTYDSPEQITYMFAGYQRNLALIDEVWV
jgi:hypothetical protein